MHRFILEYMYKRKTKDKFFIGNRVGFDGKGYLLPMEFDSEEKRDKKFDELNEKVEKSRNNLILDPFGWMNHYYKIKKRVPISNGA
jgi:hypothetical protein